MCEWTQVVLTGGPGLQQLCRGVEELPRLCCNTGNSGAGPCAGAGQGCSSCSAEEGDLCPCVSAAGHSCGSRRCSWYISQLEELLCEASWADLALQSKAGEYREPVPRRNIIIDNSCFVCRYPLQLGLLWTPYLEMPFCSGARAQHSPWKAESLCCSLGVGLVKQASPGSLEMPAVSCPFQPQMASKSCWHCLSYNNKLELFFRSRTKAAV